MSQALEAVKLDRVLGDALLCQELEDLCPLVPLKLDHSPHIFVFDKSSIASELLNDRCVIFWPCKRHQRNMTNLLEFLEDFLIIVL